MLLIIVTMILKRNESKLIQLQIIESHRDFNTIYSVKINYRVPNVGICSKPFQPAAAMKMRFGTFTFTIIGFGHISLPPITYGFKMTALENFHNRYVITCNTPQKI